MTEKELTEIEAFHKKHENRCCSTSPACGNIVGHFFPKLIRAIRDRDKIIADAVVQLKENNKEIKRLLRNAK